MTFLELAHRVLTEEHIPLKSGDIWDKAVEKGYDHELASEGKTPWATLAAQMYVNSRDSNKSDFLATNTRPKKFYLKSFSNIDELLARSEKEEVKKVAAEAKELAKKSYLEKDLHAVLAYYAHLFLRCYTKTINHSRSGKKEYGQWVHPDMVGCYFPMDDWASEVNELSNTLGNPAIKLYSFELKRRVTLTNLREVFFQTVSNSSWANESYLVAADFSADEDLMAELKRLSTSFGIGVIRLDVTDPDNSEVLLPARVSDTLDWDTINKITMNQDFTDFLHRINNDLKSREIRSEWYDTIENKEKLVAKFK
jgi:hypothetical protein